MNNKERIISVDFLRGLTVAAMILVNNPGSWDYVYPSLEHADWNGFSFADIIFPTFLFIVGISITYALSAAHKDGADKSFITKKIIKRSLTLFGIGILLNTFPFINLELYFNNHELALMDFNTFRIPGVLQRISIVFFFCALLFINTKRNTQLLIAATLLIGYWLLMTFVPVPGIGAANLGKETNLAAWFDNTLLPGHLWVWSKTWDPEGILSTIPAIATGLLGVLTGGILKDINLPSIKKVYILSSAAIVLIICGLAWNIIFHINKSLWTSSFVLFAGGLSLLILCFSYWLIDINGSSTLTGPFIAFGSNAMAAYILSETTARLTDIITINGMSVKYLFYKYVFNSWLPPFQASLVMAITWVILVYFPIAYLYKKKIFIKV
jgi:predicted acyltransferase